MSSLRVLGAIALFFFSTFRVGVAHIPDGQAHHVIPAFDDSHGSLKYQVPVESVTLGQPEEVNFICGPGNTGKYDGEFTLYPSDPTTKTLLPLEDNDFEDAVKKEILLRNISRSTNLYIKTGSSAGAGGFVNVVHSLNAVIMAKDPETFSLNYACKYQPRDRRLPPFYRWLKVSFRYVYPMAYGCESGNNMLFTNSVPKLGPLSGNSFSSCQLKAEPGMLVGIYCKPDEQLIPSDCFTDDELGRLDGEITRFIPDDQEYPNHPNYTVPSRLKLFRISENGVTKNVNLKCRCENVMLAGSALVLYKSSDESLWYHMYMGREGVKPRGIQNIKHMMEPGYTYRMIVPRPWFFTVGTFGSVGNRLAPSHPAIEAFNAPPVGPNKPTKIKELIGCKGFSIQSDVGNEYVEYELSYEKDAVVVLKKEMPFFYYDWILKRNYGKPKVDCNLRDQFYLIPTDPYTYGCGVDSDDLFRSEGIHLLPAVANRGVTECKVNPHLSSPVGFYCPKDHTLEPANCFTDMLRVSTGEVVALTNYAPHARPVESTHIKVVDFNVPNSKMHLVRYSEEELICKCIDTKGDLRATITLDLRKPE